tara:strand:- start:639 stop:1196 length:558 start_codon:yes stop_codon:yes gene_type:complete
MLKEDRLIFIVTLTLVVYASSIYLNQGAFIFPFPFNNIILLLVGFQFFFWNRKLGFPALLLLLIGLFAALGTKYYWSTFLSYEAMVSLDKSLITDVFLLCSYFCIILFAISSSLRQKTWVTLILTALFCTLFIYGQIFGELLFVIISYLIMIISNLYKPVFQPLHLIWILLFILDGSQLISFLLA